MLLQWEKDYGREFLVNDQRYIDTINEQWNVYNENKEQEKLKKVRQRETTWGEREGGVCVSSGGASIPLPHG